MKIKNHIKAGDTSKMKVIRRLRAVRRWYSALDTLFFFNWTAPSGVAIAPFKRSGAILKEQILFYTTYRGESQLTPIGG